MAEETPLTIVGNAVEAAELRFTPSGVAVAKFRIASTPRFFDKQSGEWKDGEPLFMQVVCWRQLAENVAESVEKGTRLVVTGALKPNNYETKDGEKRFGFQLDAAEVAVSLKFATAKVQRMSRSGGGGRGQGDDAWASSAPVGGSRAGSGLDETPPF